MCNVSQAGEQFERVVIAERRVDGHRFDQRSHPSFVNLVRIAPVATGENQVWLESIKHTIRGIEIAVQVTHDQDAHSDSVLTRPH